MIALVIALSILGVLNLIFSLVLLRFSVNLFVIVVNIANSIQRKFELGPNERLKPVVLRFPQGMPLTRVETGEPCGDITLLEYTNVPQMRPDDKR